MEFIKEWTVCVCITLIIAVIVSLLAPSGRLSSFYKIVISLFIFLSFLYPFTNYDIKGVDFNVEIEDKTDEMVDSMVNNEVKNLLINNNIIGANVSSDIDKNGDEIVINSIDVFVPDEYNIEDVKSLIFDELSINARVIHIGS